METKTITTHDELRSIAEEVLGLCGAHAVSLITLKGDLGAGKTAFVKALGAVLEIPSEITSPTFVVMKSYEVLHHEVCKRLVHIDAYRIESEDEMRVLGFETLLKNPSELVCIEWPERIKGLITIPVCSVEIILNSDGTRTITYGIKN